MKKLITILFSTTLAFTVLSTTAFAAPTDDTNTVQNSVTVDTNSNTMSFTTKLVLSNTGITAPYCSVEYVVTPEKIMGTNIDVEGETLSYWTGTTFNPNSNSFEPDATGAKVLSENISVNFDVAKMTTTGVYHYTITAQPITAGTTKDLQKGIVMDKQDTRHVYVYVVESDTVGTYKIANIVMTASEITDFSHVEDGALGNVANKSEGFVNGYGIDPNVDPNPETDNPAYENLVISNTLTGNMADKNKEFTLTLSDGVNIPSHTVFEVDNNGTTEHIMWDGISFVKTNWSSDGAWSATTIPVTFTLKNGQTYTIKSVIDSMSFTTTMTKENNYTIKSMVETDNQLSETEEQTNAINADGTSDETKYQPDYNLSIPDTGVVLEFLPFVLMVLLAAALITFRLFGVAKKLGR